MLYLRQMTDAYALIRYAAEYTARGGQVMGLAIVGAIALFVVAAVFAVYGVWEIALGRNMPGILGWGYFPRNRPKKSATWKPWQWRLNGVILIILAMASRAIGLTLLGH